MKRFLHLIVNNRFCLVFLLVQAMISVNPAWAIASKWAKTEGGRMRLVIDPTPRADATLHGILDVALDPGWKTYWRDPGSAGIPPLLDTAQSQNIALQSMHFPPPVRVDDGYAAWVGYTKPVQFPLIFKRSGLGAAHITMSAFIGICAKICVPFQAELSVDIPASAKAQSVTTDRVDAAFSRLPAPAAADFHIADARLDDASGKMVVSAVLPAFRPQGIDPELFVAAPEGYALAQPKRLPDKAGLARWEIALENKPKIRPKANDFDMVLTLGQRSIGETVRPKTKTVN